MHRHFIVWEMKAIGKKEKVKIENGEDGLTGDRT